MLFEEKHIAILIAFGPEVRAFVHSGLACKLAKRWKITIFTVSPESLAFETLDPAIRIAPLPSSREKISLRRMRHWARLAHQEWLDTQHWQHWQHYIAPLVANKLNKNKLLLLALMRQYFLLEQFLRAEHLMGRIFGTDSDWSRALSDVDCILTSTFSSERILPALQTSSNQNISSIVIVNSWKDIYTNPHIAVIPDRLVVWTDDIAKDLRFANRNLPQEKISVLPSLHLEKFLNPNSVIPHNQFCDQMGLDASRPYICYTAASPKAVYHEEQIVEVLLRGISDGLFPGKPQLLLRLNPMEDGSRFQALSAKYPDLVIQIPNWEWDPELDWNCALSNDIEVWLSTVYYSKMNISIPSTVTLEFIALGRPIINICFDALTVTQPDHSNLRFWNANFYSPIRENPLVNPVFSFEELSIKTKQLLETQTLIPAIARVDDSPVQKIYQIIEELLTK